MGTIALQWSLDQTGGDVASNWKQLIRVATSDNVQALPLAACERFGALVAMSSTACEKVTRLCDRSHESAVLGFLKASIGFSANDSGYFLTRSDAGQRFLGLAACLCSLDLWTASGILHSLIRSTAQDKMDVPGRKHLQALLAALEPKLARSYFTNDVVGWANIFSAKDVVIPPSDNNQTGDHRAAKQPDYTVVPGEQIITTLIQALSTISRIGEDGKERIRVGTTASEAAWLTAFVKWSLGESPRVIFNDIDGPGDESSSPVTIEVVKGNTKETWIDMYNHVEGLKQLVKVASGLSPVRGMVNIATFGQAMRQKRFGLPTSPSHRCCMLMLSYCCEQVSEQMMIQKPNETSIEIPTQLPPGVTVVKGNVFPGMQQINHVVQQYLGLAPEAKIPRPVPEIPTGGRLNDIGLMQMLKLETDTKRNSPFQTEFNTTELLESQYIVHLSYCVAEVLALSLFVPVDPDGVLVYFGGDSALKFGSTIKEFLTNFEVGSHPSMGDACSVSTVVELALRLIGHDEPEPNRWIMSSFLDQTVYPQILASGTIQSQGGLCMGCVPGNIRHDGERYNKIEVSPLVQHWEPEDDDNSDEEDSDCKAPRLLQIQTTADIDGSTTIFPRDNFTKHNLAWELTEGSSDTIQIKISVPSLPASPIRNPRYILDAVASSLFVIGSPHELE